MRVAHECTYRPRYPILKSPRMMDWINVYAAIITKVSLLLAIYPCCIPDKLNLELDRLGGDNCVGAEITNYPQKPKARFFHINVVNKHSNKPATNCGIYLISLMEEGSVGKYSSMLTYQS